MVPGAAGRAQAFYGPINQVLQPTVATRWVEALLKIPKSQDALVAIARHTGDSTRDLTPATLDLVRRKIPEALIPALEGEVEEDSAKCSVKSCRPAWWRPLRVGFLRGPRERRHINPQSCARTPRSSATIAPSSIPHPIKICSSPPTSASKACTSLAIRAPKHIGYRAVARSMSDIAAMGGTPRYCLVSFALAPWTDQRWIDGFYRGVNKLLRKTRTALAGGDISHANQFVVDVIVCGSVAKGKALLRSGARIGDRCTFPARSAAGGTGASSSRGWTSAAS